MAVGTLLVQKRDLISVCYIWDLYTQVHVISCLYIPRPILPEGAYGRPPFQVGNSPLLPECTAPAGLWQEVSSISQ